MKCQFLEEQCLCGLSGKSNVDYTLVIRDEPKGAEFEGSAGTINFVFLLHVLSLDTTSSYTLLGSTYQRRVKSASALLHF